ncbi:MAG: phosphoglucosamine mutase, partial [bacterium]
SERVREYRADIGIALDGDADRVVICDERGKLVDGDQLLALVASSWQAEGRLSSDTVVATVMSNLGLERHLQGLKLKLLRTRVGDRYVVEQMRRNAVNVGGEQSGHIILSDFTTTGDGLIAALQVLAVLVASGKPVSEVCHLFEPLPQVLENVRYANGMPLDMPEVKSAIDAAEATLGAKGRIVVRKSGTEPLIRVMGEGEDAREVRKVVQGIVDAIRAADA